MKRPAKIVLIVLLLLAIVFTLLSVKGYNLVIPLSSQGDIVPQIKAKPGDTINPFSRLDFTKDDWTAYIKISAEDFIDLNSQIPMRTCLKTTNRTLLMQMQKSWQFKITQGDAATVVSNFYLLKNGRIVFSSGIVLDKHSQGFQNSVYGWMQPVNNNEMINISRQFKPVYWPVVVF